MYVFGRFLFDNNHQLTFYSISGFSRRSSFESGEGLKESEIVVLKERRLIPIKPVKEGMQRFSFLLEICIPGSVPDPQLIGALLDLVSILNDVHMVSKVKVYLFSAQRSSYYTSHTSAGMC